MELFINFHFIISPVTGEFYTGTSLDCRSLYTDSTNFCIQRPGFIHDRHKSNNVGNI